MSTANSDRFLTRMIAEWASARGVSLKTICDGWVLQLESSDSRFHVYGYNFGINTATSHLLANDKSATAAVLDLEGVRHVPHRFFMRPEEAPYTGSSGNWEPMRAFAEQNEFDVVCKPNDGTGGRDVFRTRSAVDLERIVHALFQSYRSICLCPFVEAKQEYRVVVLDGECLLTYGKRLPCVTGAWKFNLGQGATAVDLPADDATGIRVNELALSAVRALGLRLGSVDVLDDGGSLKVLEVNSGIMMEAYSRQSAAAYEKAARIYFKILDALSAAQGSSA